MQSSSGAARKAANASQPVFPRSRSVLSKTGRFGRADRLLRNQDFKRVVKAGKRRVSEHFVVVTAGRAEFEAQKPVGRELPARPRLGVTVSKRVGNSVVRNRVKRLIREWFRRTRPELPSDADIVVIARHSACGLSGSKAFSSLDRAIDPHERRAGADGSMTAGIR